MKTLIIFDVDNTLYNNSLGAIPSQTEKLLKELFQNQEIILGLATGRGLKKLEIIQDILPLFTYKILINGAVVLKKDEIIYEEPIKTQDILEVLDITAQYAFNLGMVGINDEAVNYWDDRVSYGMKALRGIFPKVDPDFYLSNHVYQLWMFSEKEEDLLKIATKIDKFRVYPWHKGGADFVYPHINKAFGIQKAMAHEGPLRLICVGDGANDIQMIEMADIGIAMDNTRFNELKEKADHIAPHIKEDQLYEFFKSIHLV